jgi:hypothetical protein
MRCAHCHRIIRADVEVIYYRMAGATSDETTEPVGLHSKCEAPYNDGEQAPHDLSDDTL